MAITIQVNSNSEIDVAVSLAIKKIKKKITKILKSDGFYKYLGNILQEQFYTISRRELTSVETDEEFESSEYINAFHLEIKNNMVRIYNDAMVDLSNKTISDEKRANYTELSLASIVEYGIGKIGAETQITTQNEDGWQYDVNAHGDKGWHYKNKNGEWRFSKGFEGRLIFYKILTYVRENMANIIADYLKNNLKER